MKCYIFGALLIAVFIWAWWGFCRLVEWWKDRGDIGF